MPQALPRPPDLPPPQQRRSNRGTPARHDLTDIGDSTAASSTYAAPPSASATSPTTSPDHSWRPADSDPNYTLDCEEPDIGRLEYAAERSRRTTSRLRARVVELPRQPGTRQNLG